MRKKPVIALIYVLVALTLAFIWANSLDSMEESASKSEFVERIVMPILKAVLGDNVNINIRKMAHFIEFSILGAVCMALLVLIKKVRGQTIINILSLGLAAAVVDESIQIFTGRGAMVKDILLDFSGCVTGIIAIAILWGIIKLILLPFRRKKAVQRQINL